MKTIAFALITLFALNLSYAQAESKPQEDNRASYYEKRAQEDAKFEQQFTSEDAEREEAFWESQREYEKDLKKRDRKAYRAYMRGKKDAYREHYARCDAHCHHNANYYHHASFYYYGYRNYYYERYPRRSSTINTRVRIGTPRVRIGIL
ncbi:hypothetical protein Q2T40_10935 [Winogradskyella maritima]|uniref:Uncharacterized protein n=1 Tax=Winogradskyella maritima TaxID=1517766 RepID=A0ABV8AMG3_9FLAO|nr:hypothetical protein [Winogradskyella maritima]